MIINPDKNQGDLELQASPVLASVHFDPKEDKTEDFEKLYYSIEALPLKARVGLGSDSVKNEISSLAKQYEIDSSGGVGEISRIIRDVFISKIAEIEIKSRIDQKIKLPADKSGEFLIEIKKIISLVLSEGGRIASERTEKIAIIPALKKYEGLGEQEITTEKIIQKNENQEEQMVDPSIRNWVNDYIQKKGAQAHDNLERSDYLYRSQNTETLPTQERERLSVVLRSYDNDELLLIDKEDEKVLFTDSPKSEMPNTQRARPAHEAQNQNQAKTQSLDALGPKQQSTQPQRPIEQARPKMSVRKSNEIGWFGQQSVVGKEDQASQKTNTQNQDHEHDKAKKFFTNPSYAMKKVTKQKGEANQDGKQEPKSMNVVDLKDM